MKSIPALCRLFSNGLRFQALKLSGRPHRIEALSLEVTHRCICRCAMCNIWKIPAERPDLDLSRWVALLSSAPLAHLRELDLTGGEPFLRSDLGDLVEQICALHPERFPRLRTLSITTNGILTDRILSTVRRIVEPLSRRGIDLVFALGVDATGELHDRIRNYKGAWARLQTTLSGLKALRKTHSNLVLGLKTTIIPANVGELDRLADYAEDHELFTIISPCIITPNRFGNLDRENSLRFSPQQVEQLITFFRNPRFAWSGHREALLAYLESGRMNKPCSAGFNTLFVRHNGEVFGCPVLAVSLGNIQSEGLEDIFQGSAAVRFRRKVGRFPDCGRCTEPGMERIAWPLHGFALLEFWARRGGEDFRRMVSHMGLDKYLEDAGSSATIAKEESL